MGLGSGARARIGGADRVSARVAWTPGGWGADVDGHALGGGGGGTQSFVQDSSPSPADEGDLWRDTTTNFQYVFNGGWKPVEIDIAGLDPLPT